MRILKGRRKHRMRKARNCGSGMERAGGRGEGRGGENTIDVSCSGVLITGRGKKRLRVERVHTVGAGLALALALVLASGAGNGAGRHWVSAPK